MTADESGERKELTEDRAEDLDLDGESADSVRGGSVNKLKTADKAFDANKGYIEG